MSSPPLEEEIEGYAIILLKLNVKSLLRVLSVIAFCWHVLLHLNFFHGLGFQTIFK